MMNNDFFSSLNVPPSSPEGNTLDIFPNSSWAFSNFRYMSDVPLITNVVRGQDFGFKTPSEYADGSIALQEQIRSFFDHSANANHANYQNSPFGVYTNDEYNSIVGTQARLAAPNAESRRLNLNTPTALNASQAFTFYFVGRINSGGVALFGRRTGSSGIRIASPNELTIRPNNTTEDNITLASNWTENQPTLVSFGRNTSGDWVVFQDGVKLDVQGYNNSSQILVEQFLYSWVANSTSGTGLWEAVLWRNADGDFSDSQHVQLYNQVRPFYNNAF